MAKLRRFYIYAVLSGMQFTFTTWLAFVVAHGGNPGWAEAAYHMAIVLGEVPTGLVADLIGRRVSILVGLALTVIQPLLYFTIHDTLSACLVLGLSGLAGTFFSGADTALAYETAESIGGPELARKVIARIQALQLTSLAVAPAIAGLLYQWHDWAPPAGRAIIALITAVVVWGMAETKGDAPGEERRSVWTQTRTAVGLVRNNHAILLMSVFAWFYNTAYSMTGQFGQVYFPFIGLSMGVTGLVFTASTILNSGGGWISSRLSGSVASRFLRIAPLGVGLAILSMGLGAPALGIGSYVLLGLIDGILYPVWLARMNEQIPNAQRATVLSLQSMGVSVLMSMAFPAASYLHPVPRIYLTTGAVASVLAVAWLFARFQGVPQGGNEERRPL